jgi:predicted Mrr-cat superfamily restriction endonuclease
MLTGLDQSSRMLVLRMLGQHLSDWRIVPLTHNRFGTKWLAFIIKVQCKQVTDPIGRPAVTQLLGNIEAGEHGLFVTLGSYSKDARELDRSKPNLRLIDGEQLVELVFRDYKSFEPRYQALLPLKRIYVPAPGSRE